MVFYDPRILIAYPIAYPITPSPTIQRFHPPLLAISPPLPFFSGRERKGKEYRPSGFWSDDNPISLISQYFQSPSGIRLLPHIQRTGFCVQPS